MWGYLSSALTGKYEQPPYPCASPLRKLEADDEFGAVTMSAEVLESVKSLMADTHWKPVEFRDPDGADLKLFDRSAVGTFHYVRATLTIPNANAERVIEVMHPTNEVDRKKFSADLLSFKVVHRVTPEINIQHLEYWAPPPVAGRDFCFLSCTNKYEDGSAFVVGCSINCPAAPKGSYAKQVRAASMWGWHLKPVGDACALTYVNCFDMKGWAPRFLIAWLKSSCSNELIAARTLLAGGKAELVKTELQDIGVTEEEIKASEEAEKAAIKEEEEELKKQKK